LPKPSRVHLLNYRINLVFTTEFELETIENDDAAEEPDVIDI